MIFDEETIYSKRYPSAEAELEEFSADTTMPVITPEQRETAYQKFRSRMNSKPHYEPIPGREEKAQEFIEQAKSFSEDNEIDIDIRQLPYAVEVCLHFYCAAWSKDMTHQFAQLFNLCDNLSSFILKSEPSDFTLILGMDTHDCYLSDELVNDF